mgnify:CR=1 FL=1
MEFYKQFNPSKVGEVQTVVNRYKGNERVLCQRLEAKYCKGQNVLQKKLDAM